METEHMKLGSKGKGVRTPKIKVGVTSKRTTKMSSNCEELRSGVEHSFDEGFEMFKQYANHVDPNGGWGNVTIDTVKSVFPQKSKKGKEPR